MNSPLGFADRPREAVQVGVPLPDVTAVPADLPSALAAFGQELQRTESVAHIEYFKLGTEEEGLDFGEIAFIRSVLPASADIVIKIGGPCARADIRQAKAVGACGLVAPMVESEYGLARFIEAATEVFGTEPGLRLGINVETRTAWAALPAMLADPNARKLTFINVGRSDLAASLGFRVTDEPMHAAVCDIVRQVGAHRLPAMVGGSVTVASLRPLVERVTLAGFQTRCVAFRLGPGAELERVVPQALQLEIALMRVLAARFPERAGDHLARLHVATARLGG
ncbi:MAG: hypothetical protein EXR79_02280 [Myxococcales bacterium]|nr:hypothetical protein [Myxococcales bacterium]